MTRKWDSSVVIRSFRMTVGIIKTRPLQRPGLWHCQNDDYFPVILRSISDEGSPSESSPSVPPLAGLE